jgi:H+/gluconate symporter-like permease
VRAAGSRPLVDGGGGIYAAAAALLAIGERNYIYVKPRLLFVSFPALLPLADWLARQTRRRLVAIGVPVALASTAYNTYLLVGWPRAL